ncbi:MAG: dihydrofolate reductase [Planctomycetota bacterium]
MTASPSPAPPPARLSLIAAMSENRVIGRDNALPWRLPDEMQQFRAYTLGHPVVMGRKNFEAESKPLPHRRNLVLTTQPDWQPLDENGKPLVPGAGVEVFHDFDAALAVARAADPEPYVIGGAKIYELAIPVVDRMVLTTVHAEIDGDTFFPGFDPADWSLTDQRHHQADARHAHAFTVNTYDRIR